MSSKNFDFAELDDFTKDVYNSLENKYPKKARSFMRKEASKVKKDAEGNTPEDSGNLKEHWKMGTKLKKTVGANLISAKVTNNANHSHLIENGHYLVNGGWWEGKHMLENAVKKLDLTFSTDVESLVDKALKECNL